MSSKNVIFALALIFPGLILGLYYGNYALAIWLGVNQYVAYFLAAFMTFLSLFLIQKTNEDLK